MKHFKLRINKNIKLGLMTDDTPFSLMFLPENDGNFRQDSTSSDKEKENYIDFLKKASNSFARFTIFYKGEIAGFILIAGMDGRLVGGIFPEYQRKGIYTIARNTIIHAMNLKGMFTITSSVNKNNSKMKKFLSTVYQTTLNEGLRINHFNPNIEICAYDNDFTVKVPKTDWDLYHISFDPDLPEVIRPKFPDSGAEDLSSTSDGNETKDEFFPENLPPRFSASPSPELCFRAIYPNIAHLLEDIPEPEIHFNVYKVMTGKVTYEPKDLIENELVHDAHITLEHVYLKPVFIRKVGRISFKNTSGDSGLSYLPFCKYEKIYHSPKEIISAPL